MRLLRLIFKYTKNEWLIPLNFKLANSTGSDRAIKHVETAFPNIALQ